MKTCEELLEEYMLRRNEYRSKKINFIGVEGFDVYNITGHFEDNENLIIAGRVEKRDTEYSNVMFFKKLDNDWIRMEDVGVFELQDPFVTKINGELVLGGVEVYPHKTIANTLGYRTVFYKGNNIKTLVKFASGPEMMKDIRLIELEDKNIAVFTRPQGEVGGCGQIGFTILKSLTELNENSISSAQLLLDQFSEKNWGGANELHILKNGLIGVLGHIAYYDENRNRHYHSVTFAINPSNKQTSPLKVIAIRDDFEPGEYKREDIIDVIFSGGLRRLGNGCAELYAGVSDAEAHLILISDPFEEYEKVELM